MVLVSIIFFLVFIPVDIAIYLMGGTSLAGFDRLPFLIAIFFAALSAILRVVLKTIWRFVAKKSQNYQRKPSIN